jgi:hypothetical protein
MDDEQQRPRYVTDEAVFPHGVVDALRRACGGVRKVVTFRSDPKKGPTTSEAGLPPALVMVCRRLLSDGGHLRTVHVRGTHNVGKPPNPHKEHAITLVELGYSAQAVADALGVHRVTVARWTRAGTRTIKPAQAADLFSEGVEILVRNLRALGKLHDDDPDPTRDELADVLGMDSESKLSRRACLAASCFREFRALIEA